MNVSQFIFINSFNNITALLLGEVSCNVEMSTECALQLIVCLNGWTMLFLLFGPREFNCFRSHYPANCQSETCSVGECTNRNVL